MTGYAAMSARGRDAAHDTNTRFKLQTVVEYREVTNTHDGRYIGQVGHLIGECGHVVDIVRPAPWYATMVVGKRKRCPHCPMPARTEVPDAERCTYDWETERGVTRCKTRARFYAADPDVMPAVWLRLCRKHHDHLTREGYLVPDECVPVPR